MNQQPKPPPLTAEQLAALAKIIVDLAERRLAERRRRAVESG